MPIYLYTDDTEVVELTFSMSEEKPVHITDKEGTIFTRTYVNPSLATGMTLQDKNNNVSKDLIDKSRAIRDIRSKRQAETGDKNSALWTGHRLEDSMFTKKGVV